MVNPGGGKYMIYPFRLGIGNKHLPETIIAHQVYNPVNAIAVEFIENIIKKQNGFIILNSAGIFKLSQFDGNHK